MIGFFFTGFGLGLGLGLYYRHEIITFVHGVLDRISK